MIIPTLTFGRHILNQLETGIIREWLETNGIGSYASGTIVGANTRRYHALYTMTLNSHLKRMVMVNRIEESLLINGHRVDCSCQEYPGTISPQGYLHLENFGVEPFPQWVYSIDDLKLQKIFFTKSGEETSVLVYKHLVGPTIKLILRPFLSCRNSHALIREDQRFKDAVSIDGYCVRCAVPNQPEFYINVGNESVSGNNLKIYIDGYWYKNLLYAIEEEKELDYQEDLYSPCQILAELSQGQQIAIIFSNQKAQNVKIDKWIEQEIFVRNQVLEKFPIQTPFAKRLALAADQFLVHCNGCVKIVGGCSCREDTIRECLMSLPGICLATHRFEEAKTILSQMSKFIYQGLLPERCFEGEVSSSYYNNMDNSLWFVWAVQKYWEATKDLEFMKEMKPHIESVIQSFQKGIKMEDSSNPMEVRVDEDALILGISTKTPLTWMNGKVGDWVANLRRGKPVEIQALWYNALQFYSEISLKSGGDGNQFVDLAKKVRESFNMLFWNSQTNYLYDVIDGNTRESSVRPNALYAISMPYEILDHDKFKPVFETAWKTLYTSLGLRTLSPGEPHFHGICKGDEKGRASALYNGAVVPFLIGPFLTSYFKTYGREQKNKEEAIHFLYPFVDHLSDAGLGTISEAFDGNSPHNPRGCIADARSVAEILRVMKEEGLTL